MYDCYGKFFWCIEIVGGGFVNMVYRFVGDG